MKSWVIRGLLACLAVLALTALPGGAAPAQVAVAADTLRNVRFGDHGTFERAVLDLGTADARGIVAPEYTASYREGDWVIRVGFPAVDNTFRSGGAGLGRAISRYYVVRSGGTARSLFVDVHLTDAAKSVRVFKLDNPARIAVDVTPGGTALFPKPKTGASAVVLQPRASSLSGPSRFTVSGYGRPFEASGAWRVKDSSGRIVSRGTYTTSDWYDTWGAFTFAAAYPVNLSGHTGAIEAGGLSPADGSFRGVAVPLRFR